MTPQEEQLIRSVVDRLRQATSTTQTIDPAVEALIQREVLSQPHAGYFLTQALIIQDHVLKDAEARIQQLTTALQQTQQTQGQGSGGFLSGLFGGHSTPAPVPPPPPPTYAGPHSGFGDFMKGAAATALGVAGGSLLYDGLRGMFSGGGGLGYGAGPGFGGGMFTGGGAFGGSPVVVENITNITENTPASGGDFGQDSPDFGADQPDTDYSGTGGDFDDGSGDAGTGDDGTDFDDGGGSF